LKQFYSLWPNRYASHLEFLLRRYPLPRHKTGLYKAKSRTYIFERTSKVPTTMSDDRFSDYIARERERLSREREEISNQKRELDNRLAAIDREFQALDAYQAAKTGNPSGARRPQMQRRARRGSRREELLNLIRAGNGLSRREILERLDLKGDQAGEMSVSNALSALTKRNQVRREGGKYYPGSPEAGEPELPLGTTEGDQPPEAGGEVAQDR
jgi:hypothetical protein